MKNAPEQAREAEKAKTPKTYQHKKKAAQTQYNETTHAKQKGGKNIKKENLTQKYQS